MARMPNEPGDAAPDAAPDRAPGAVVSHAHAAFDDLDAAGEQLAPLVYDSLTAGATAADGFWLVFQHPHAQLQVSVRANGTASDLHGRVDPPEAMGAVLEIDGAEVALVEHASQGSFTFRAVPAGVMRLAITGIGGSPLLHTDWFVLGARSA